MKIVLGLASLRRLLLAAVCVLVGLGLIVEVAYNAFDWSPERLVSLFSLSYEENVPTWYSAAVMFASGVLLAAIGGAKRRASERFAFHWWLLAITFFYFSIDELMQLHESLGQWRAMHGIFYFSWVIPAAAFVVAWTAIFVPFVRHLPSRTQRRFIAAGAVYVLGALVLELPLGWWTERHGNENLGYALIDWVEETLEIVGLSLFLYSIVEYMAVPEDRVLPRS